MSTDNNKRTDEENSADDQTSDADGGELGRKHSTTYQTKLSVHKRDRYTCINCRENFNDPDDVADVDVDHVIPKGAGGANTIRNKVTLCRRCHEAKHGERDHGPTIRAMSTGDMPDPDFRLYKQFWDEIIPAMSEVVLNHRVTPKLDLADEAPYTAWHIPTGEVRRLDEVLSDMDDITYAGLGAHNYM